MKCHVFKKIVCIAVMVCASLAAHSAEQFNTDEVNGASPVSTVSAATAKLVGFEQQNQQQRSTFVYVGNAMETIGSFAYHNTLICLDHAANWLYNNPLPVAYCAAMGFGIEQSLEYIKGETYPDIFSQSRENVDIIAFWDMFKPVINRSIISVGLHFVSFDMCYFGRPLQTKLCIDYTVNFIMNNPLRIFMLDLAWRIMDETFVHIRTDFQHLPDCVRSSICSSADMYICAAIINAFFFNKPSLTRYYMKKTVEKTVEKTANFIVDEKLPIFVLHLASGIMKDAIENPARPIIDYQYVLPEKAMLSFFLIGSIVIYANSIKNSFFPRPGAMADE